MKKDRNIICEIIIRIFKRTKIRTLILLVVLLSLNTTAWFIYATKVDSGIGAKIVAWNVAFVTGENELLEYVNFKIDNVYPGMESYTKRIDVTNKGESNALLKYEIDSARILDSEYKVNNSTITSVSLLNSLAQDYPFKIKVGVSASEITPKESAYFYVTVYWDYESGDDEQDSYWGNKAYDFHELYPEEDSMEINLIISAIQKSKE